MPDRGDTLLVLCRHGQTRWHHENRYAGVSDVELTAEGVAQARELAAWTTRTRPSTVVSSPLRRAVETATPSAEALGRELVVVEGLREVDFGLAEGHTMDELRGVDHDMVERFSRDPASHPFPGAEPPAEAAERGAACLRTLAERDAGHTVLVVAHNTLLRLALCALLGIDVARYRTVFPRLDNAALTSLRVTAAGTAGLLAFNVPLGSAAARPESLGA